MTFSRRNLMRAAIAFGAARALPAVAAPPQKRRAVVAVVFRGGFSAIHATPNTLGGAFNTTADSMLPTGTGLFVDKATFGQLSPTTLRQMAVVGVDHGITAHAPAISAVFTGQSNYPLTLAAAMSSEAALRCAMVGEAPSFANFAPVPGASLTTVYDVRSAIDILVGSNRPGEPSRLAMSKGLKLAYELSRKTIEQNPRTLSAHASGYDTVVHAMTTAVRPVDWASIAQAYGVPATQTEVTSNASRFAAAELAIQGGTPVVIVSVSADQSCGEAGWDTHGDSGGTCLRGMMAAMAMPHLKTFLDRTLAMADVEVSTLVFGEFGRDPYLSDHARCLSAAVFGPRVKPGTTGPATATEAGKLALPQGTPGIAQMWALMGELAGASSKPFGANPHAQLVVS